MKSKTIQRWFVYVLSEIGLFRYTHLWDPSGWEWSPWKKRWSFSNCAVALNFYTMMQYESSGVPELLKSTVSDIQNGGRRQNCIYMNLNTEHKISCSITLKFGTWVHYGSAKPASHLKPETTGLAVNLKWQCIANCHISSLCWVPNCLLRIIMPT